MQSSAGLQVQDIVMARQRNGKLWPGKLTQVGVMMEVKFYRVKQPLKLPAREVQPYSQSLAQQAIADCSDKVLLLAIKMAEKGLQERIAKRGPIVDLEAIDEGNLATDSQGSGEPKQAGGLNRSRLAMSLHVIKEEQDNVKQEQGEEEKALVVYFPDYLQFLLAENIDTIIADSRKNLIKEYAYLSSTTKQPVIHHSYPRHLLLCLLQQFFNQAHRERDIKLRVISQRKALSILNSGIIDLSICMQTRVMKWVEYCLRGMKTRELNRTDQQFSKVVEQFRKTTVERFENYLDDYTNESRLARSLALISRAFRKQ